MCCFVGHHGYPQTSHNFLSVKYGENGSCVCRGTDGNGCCGYATQADGLCPRCREHCGRPDDTGAGTASVPESEVLDDSAPIPYALVDSA